MGESSRYKCPTCQRPISWDAAFPYRPFCSERCKMVDFGAWVSGMHAIPGEPALPEEGIAPERDPDRSPDSGAH